MKKVLAGKTILIVDDEDDLRDIIAQPFFAMGCKTISVADGKEAIATLMRERVDLIITDFRMPKINGFALLDWLIQHQPQRPPLFLISAFNATNGHKVADAMDRGADAVFSKPFDIKDLMDAAYQALSPLAKRWSAQQPLDTLPTPSYQLTRSWSSVEEAIAQGDLALGRKGFFLATKQDLPFPLTPVAFNLSFVNGSLDACEGIGVVRWVRQKATPDLPAGIGVEILTLRTGHVETFQAYLAHKGIPVASIPKGGDKRREIVA